MNPFTNLKEFEDQLTENQLQSIMSLIETDSISCDFEVKLIDLLYNIGIQWKIGQALMASKYIINASVG